MSHQITIRSEPIGLYRNVTGFVGTNEVISISNGVGWTWHVSSSAILPNDLSEASAYVECMQRTFARACEHGAPIFKDFSPVEIN